MAEGDLAKLWKLHLIDTSILEIRARAAALDPGKKIQSEIDALNKQLIEKGGTAKALGAELTDLELKQKQIEEKIKKFDKTMYGGNVVNPREVENIQKEIEALRRQRNEHDSRILELWDLVPPARADAEKLEAAIKERQSELAEYQKTVVQAKHELESEFKSKVAQRPQAAAAVPRAQLDRYESIRQKNGGVAMARLIIKTGTCGSCGMKLPTKTIELAKEERLVTCEACHRILYYSESVV